MARAVDKYLTGTETLDAGVLRKLLAKELSVMHLEDIGEEVGKSVVADVNELHIVLTTSPNSARLKHVGEHCKVEIQKL